MNEAVSSVLEQDGRIDCLIASAGCSNPNYFEDLPISEFQRAMNINFIGSVASCKAVLPHFKKQLCGRIVLVGSLAGLVGVHGYTAYSPSKFAIRGFAEALHMEVKPYNIQVSVCHPPDVDTPMYEHENETKPEECRRISQSAGLFQASDVADSIVSGIRHYRFAITNGLDGHFLTLLTIGMSPASNFGIALLEVILAPLLRMFSLIALHSYNDIVQGVYDEKLSDPNTKDGKKSE